MKKKTPTRRGSATAASTSARRDPPNSNPKPRPVRPAAATAERARRDGRSRRDRNDATNATATPRLERGGLALRPVPRVLADRDLRPVARRLLTWRGDGTFFHQLPAVNMASPTGQACKTITCHWPSRRSRSSRLSTQPRTNSATLGWELFVAVAIAEWVPSGGSLPPRRVCRLPRPTAPPELRVEAPSTPRRITRTNAPAPTGTPWARAAPRRATGSDRGTRRARRRARRATPTTTARAAATREPSLG